MGKILNLGASLLLLAAPALATELIVEPGGSTPYATIQSAMDVAVAGDVIVVSPGTYTENVTMTSGVELRSSSGPGVTTIDANESIGINCERCLTGTIISGFTFTNGGGYTGGGVRVFDLSDVEIKDNIFFENHTTFEGAGITVQRDSNADIHDNQFIGNTSFRTSAITVIVRSNADIYRNLFKDNRSADLAAAIGVNRSSVIVRDNLFVANVSGASGGTIDVFGGSIQLINNTFLRNIAPLGATCLRVNGGALMTATKNLFAHNSGPAPAVAVSSCYPFSCNVFYDNGTDFIGPCNPIGENDNQNIEALVCDPAADDGAVSDLSPCLSGACGVIGANALPGCSEDVVATETLNWGAVKSNFQRN